MKVRDRLSHPVLIVGAGVAGLACALALAKAGFESILCERAQDLAHVGAGLQLSANALSVLERLGLKSAILERGFPARTVALRDGASDRLLVRVPVESGSDGYVAVHRADLQSALLEAVWQNPLIDIRLGRQFLRSEPEPFGRRAVFLNVAGGEEEVEASLLIGADGVHSAVASSLRCARPIDRGLIAHRLSISDAPGEEIEAWLSPSSHAVSYPMRRSGERNLVVVEAGGRSAGPPAASRWNPRLQAFLSRGAYLGAWPLLTVDTAERLCTFQRAVFIGDSAHAMFPFAAQGAAMALEDAWVLACCLASQPTIEASLEAYVHARRPRIEAVLKRVRFHRMIYHMGWPLSLARDLGMKLRPESAMRSDLAWLYDWRANEIPTPR